MSIATEESTTGSTYDVMNRKQQGDHASVTRARSLSITDVAAVVHLPISKAAARLDIGVTTLKKYCRQMDIKGWPYRQIESLRRFERDLQRLGLSPEEVSNAHRALHQNYSELTRWPFTTSMEQSLLDIRQAIFKLKHIQRRRAVPPDVCKDHINNKQLT